MSLSAGKVKNEQGEGRGAIGWGMNSRPKVRFGRGAQAKYRKGKWYTIEQKGTHRYKFEDFAMSGLQ